MSYGTAAVILCTEIGQSLFKKFCKVTFACGLLALSHTSLSLGGTSRLSVGSVCQ